MALGGLVHLLFEHALVHGTDGPLGTAVDPPVDALRRAKREFGHRAADAARDALGAGGDLVATVVAFTPLLGAVRVAHRHPHNRYRIVHAGHRCHPGDAPASADDHLAVDGLAQDAVGASDVVLALRGDRGRLEAEASLLHGPRSGH